MSGSLTPPGLQQVGAPFYDRRMRLVAAGQAGEFEIDLGELRVTFEIRQFDLQSPNTLDMYIWNLSERTAQAFKKEFTELTLSAGYVNTVAPIFNGGIKQFRYGRFSPTDTYLNIRASDGDIVYIQATINTTLAAGATAEDCVQAVLRALAPFGITRGTIAPLPTWRSPRAIVLSGMVRDVMRTLAQTWGMTWSIFNKKLVILPLSGPPPSGTEAIILSSATGMIGMPEQTIEGIQARSLLNPRLQIGAIVKIDNKSIQRGIYDLSYLGDVRNSLLDLVRVTEDGQYRVMVADHVGDTRGDPWYTEIICVALGDPPPLASAQRGRS